MIKFKETQFIYVALKRI